MIETTTEGDISLEEVADAIKGMNNGKIPRCDNITTEMVKHIGEEAPYKSILERIGRRKSSTRRKRGSYTAYLEEK